MRKAIIILVKRTSPAFFSAKPSRPRRSRCPGSRRCCCRAACGRTRRPGQERHALRDQQQGQEVPHLPLAQGVDAGVVGRPLVAAVAAEVVVPAVAVVLAVGLVVLAVVADQVVEREAIVAGDEIDRVVGVPRGVAVEVEAAADPLGQRRWPRRVAADEAADIVAEVAVQFGPAAPGGKLAELVTGRPRPTPRRSASCRPAPGARRCAGSAAGPPAPCRLRPGPGWRPGRSGSHRRASRSTR